MNTTHPDDIAIDEFAIAMKARMAQKRAEGSHGWALPKRNSIDTLWILLARKLSVHNSTNATDIGNYAMMIWYRETKGIK